MWAYLRWAGIYESELEWFLENTCEPDVIGVNYYLTSERFLDHRIEPYPAHVVGGNGPNKYADVEGVRVLADGIDGVEKLLGEVGSRYQQPIAVTEVHNGCTREEQARWLLDIWNAAQRARQNGGNVVAVTAWALLGAFDWNSLVTRDEGCYEPGLFDVRAAKPRRTALAAIARDLVRGEIPNHPLFEAPGWWKRPERLLFGTSYPEGRSPQVCSINVNPQCAAARPVLITGKAGTLGEAYARTCDVRGIAYRVLGRDEMDIADRDSVAQAVTRYHPWAIVNTAGYAHIDDAEIQRDRCFRENTQGPAILAAICAAEEIPLMTISTDQVFDGESRRPYVESDKVNPLNRYGESKAEAERRVFALFPRALVIRTSAIFGPWDESNFVTRTLLSLVHGEEIRLSSDIVSPTYLPDLVDASLDLLIDGEAGLWHLANRGSSSWVALAKQVARLAGLDASLVIPSSARRLEWIARRPHYSSLASERADIMPKLDSALARYLQDCTINWRAAEQVAVSS